MSKPVSIRNFHFDMKGLLEVLGQKIPERMNKETIVVHSSSDLSILEIKDRRKIFYLLMKIRETTKELVLVGLRNKPVVIPNRSVEEYVKEDKVAKPVFNKVWFFAFTLPIVFFIMSAVFSRILAWFFPWIQNFEQYRTSMMSGSILTVSIVIIAYQIHVNFVNERIMKERLEIQDELLKVLDILKESMRKHGKKIVCWNCYAENPPGTQFCYRCGSLLKK